MYQDDYSKVEGLLPTSSYTDKLYNQHHQKIILIYVLEGYITSHGQYRWISNIKLGLEKYLCVPFTYEDEFSITDSTEVTTALYQIKELSKAFKAPLIIYPKACAHLIKFSIKYVFPVPDKPAKHTDLLLGIPPNNDAVNAAFKM